MNDNYPTFPLSQYIVQGIAETVAVGTDIIQGLIYLSYILMLISKSADFGILAFVVFCYT